MACHHAADTRWGAAGREVVGLEGDDTREDKSEKRRPIARLSDPNITIEDIRGAIESQRSEITIERLKKGLAIDLMREIEVGGGASGIISSSQEALRHCIIAFVRDATDKTVTDSNALWKYAKRVHKKLNALTSSKRQAFREEEFKWRVTKPLQAPFEEDVVQDAGALGEKPNVPLFAGGAPIAAKSDEPPLSSPIELHRRLKAVEKMASDAHIRAQTAESRAATAESRVKSMAKQVSRGYHKIRMLEAQNQVLHREATEVSIRAEVRNQQQRERRMRGKIDSLRNELAIAIKSSESSERTVEKRDQTINRLKSRVHRAKSTAKQLRDRTEETIIAELTKAADAPIATRDSSPGKPYSPLIRKCILDLLSHGVAMEKIGQVMSSVAGNLFEKELSELPDIRTVGRIAAEAGILAEIVAAKRWIANVNSSGGVPLYMDTTGYRNIDQFALSSGDFQTDADGQQFPSTFVIGLQRLASHSSDDQYDSVLEMLSDLARIADEAGISEVDKLSLRFLMIVMADHAADQNRLSQMLAETKAEEWEHYFTSTPGSGGWLMQTEQTRNACRTVVKAGCGMHKLNIMSRVARGVMVAWWKTSGQSCPVGLPNKGIVSALLSYDADEDDIVGRLKDVENVDGGGYKAMQLLSMLFANPDGKKGYGDTWSGFLASRGVTITLQYVSEVRFASAEANAGPVLKHALLMAEFLQQSRAGKDSNRFNNLENNVTNALRDDSTLDELAVMGIMYTLIHVPFLRIVRDRRGVGAVMRDVVPMEKRMADWAAMSDDVLLNGLRLVGSEAKGSLSDIAGNVVEKKHVYEGFDICVEQLQSRRHCVSLFRSVLPAMASKLGDTVKPFSEGGEYSELDGPLAVSLDYCLATNDISESIFGQLKQACRNAPNARLDTVSGPIMYRHNILNAPASAAGVSDITEHMAYAMSEGRKRRRVPEARLKQAVLEIKDRKRQKKIEHRDVVAARKAERDKAVRGVIPVVTTDGIAQLNAPQLLQQLQRWQIEVPKDVVLSHYKKKEAKRTKLLELFEAHPEVVAKLKSEVEEREKQAKEETERLEIERQRREEEERPFEDYGRAVDAFVRRDRRVHRR